MKIALWSQALALAANFFSQGAIGRDFFPGKAGPTCWTCHRGNVKPEIEPPPTQTAPAK